jgi:hypothetical protein
VATERQQNLSYWQVRRNQAIVAAISTVLLAILWATGSYPGSMNFTIPGAMVVTWIPVVLAPKLRQGSIAWNSLFGLLGLTVAGVAVRAIWMIGQG